MAPREFVALAAAAILILGTLSGCTSSSRTMASADPYAADYAAAQKLATSDFEREALSDGKITRAEYDEANQLWLACMDEAFPPGQQPDTNRLELNDDGLYQYAIDIPAAAKNEFNEKFYDQVNDKCAEGTIANIAALYNDETTNPSGIPLADRIATCLVGIGFVDPGYSGDDVSRDYFDKADGEALDLPQEVRDCLDKETHSQG